MKDKRFVEGNSLAQYQNLMREIYSEPGDRNFSLEDLLAQQQRFTMRALKGIRKNDQPKLKRNLLNALSWAMSVGTRLHLNVEDLVWNRFPGHCSYCGKVPCSCKKEKPKRRA